MHACGEGGSGEKQGEREWWEDDRRERENVEKQGGGERREDDMREGRDVKGREGGGRGIKVGGRTLEGS